MRKHLVFLASLLGLFFLSANPAGADEARFYKGKTIRIVIGTSVGGSYGVFSQLAARHMGKYIPGNPNLVPVSMPGPADWSLSTTSLMSHPRTAPP